MGTENQKTEAERTPFVVEIDEHYPFDSIAATKFVTSTELCKMISDLLKNVFADYEGCIFETNQGMEPTIALIFNHDDHSNSDLPCACERAGSKQVGNTVIDRGRARDMYNRSGDRYFLSEDGQDFVKTLVTGRSFNNGKLDFKRLVSEFSDPGPMNNSFYQQLIQYTKVSFISINKICGLLFGTDEENDDHAEYMVSIATPLMTNYGRNNNYVLRIEKVSAKEISSFCNKIGITMQAVNIIR